MTDYICIRSKGEYRARFFKVDNFVKKRYVVDEIPSSLIMKLCKFRYDKAENIQRLQYTKNFRCGTNDVHIVSIEV